MEKRNVPEAPKTLIHVIRRQWTIAGDSGGRFVQDLRDTEDGIRLSD